jgi:hypothetical protein
MLYNRRILLGIVILVLIIAVVLGVDAYQRNYQPSIANTPKEVTVLPGSIPVYMDERLIAAVSPDNLTQLKKESFTDPVEAKVQEGWLLRDVLALYIKTEDLKPDTHIIVSSSSRNKSVDLTWSEVNLYDNMVMFDLSNRGTLKLASKMEKLDSREEWIQDVDKIEIITK